MKKFLAALLFVSLAVQASFALTVIPKAGVDISGTMNYEKDADEETKRGFVVGADAGGDISGYFGWRAGFEYLFPRGFASLSGDNDFSFFPVYVSLLFYPFGAWDKARPYIKAGAGYSVLAMTAADADITGGFFWTAGIGAEYKRFVGEMSVSDYGGEYDGQKFSYQKIGFTLGYKFDIKLLKSKQEKEGEDF